MEVIGYATLLLSVGATAAALAAALFSLRANRVVVDPGWRTEPFDPTLANMGWIAGTLRALDEAGRLNRLATMWAIASVIFSGFAGIVGALASLS